MNDPNDVTVAQMEETVAYLATMLKPALAALGDSLDLSVPGVKTEVFSYRHAVNLHTFGLNCFPRGSDALDANCVAVNVNVLKQDALVVRGFVTWQAPSFKPEAATSAFENPSLQELPGISAQVIDLFAPFRAAVKRGHPIV
jgi:hypothetical protein